jgi:cobalt/nickel transport system permease protein
MLNWVTEGNPVIVLHQFQQPLQIGHWSFPETLTITDNGIRSAMLFVSRVGISVSIAVLLLTTAWQNCCALAVLGVPQFFVFTLE